MTSEPNPIEVPINGVLGLHMIVQMSWGATLVEIKRDANR